MARKIKDGRIKLEKQTALAIRDPNEQFAKVLLDVIDPNRGYYFCGQANNRKGEGYWFSRHRRTPSVTMLTRMYLTPYFYKFYFDEAKVGIKEIRMKRNTAKCHKYYDLPQIARDRFGNMLVVAYRFSVNIPRSHLRYYDLSQANLVVVDANEAHLCYEVDKKWLDFVGIDKDEMFGFSSNSQKRDDLFVPLENGVVNDFPLKGFVEFLRFHARHDKLTVTSTIPITKDSKVVYRSKYRIVRDKWTWFGIKDHPVMFEIPQPPKTTYWQKFIDHIEPLFNENGLIVLSTRKVAGALGFDQKTASNYVKQLEQSYYLTRLPSHDGSPLCLQISKF